MIKPIYIFGAASLARHALYYALREQNMRVMGYVVDTEFLQEDRCVDIPVMSWEKFLERIDPGAVDVFVAIGYKSMRKRAEIYLRVKKAGYNFCNIVSKAAFIAETATMGNNNIIMPGTVIEPSVVLGSNNVIWSNVTICHDSKIGDHNFFAANSTIGGEVKVGDGNFFGFSSVVLQQVTIGNETLIGAQAQVRHDTQNLHRYYGISTKIIDPINGSTGILID